MATEVISHGRVTWTNIVNPTEDDVRALSEAYPHFHPLDLEDLRSHTERPKIDEYEDYLFVVMQFPLWDAKRQISRPGEVDMFVGSGYLVTVHDGALKPLVDFFERCRNYPTMRDQYLGQGASRAFYSVIDRLADNIFPILDKVNQNIHDVEDNMFSRDMLQVIQQITLLRRDIISLRRIIRPQVDIIAALEGTDRPFIREELEVYFGDILDHIKKARDIVDDEYEVIEVLAEASDTLASHRINQIMQVLTVISVIILPLTLITSFYGMNIPLVGEDDPNSFWVIGLSLAVIALGLLAYFKHRRWL
ncbi:MAG: magnesium transporter CorA family protein [Anaerolineae bacterium]|nr:magnesium transporter CorA family protein [Anaerolineae bacterium]